MGIYLGVPTLHNRVTKDTYGYLIDKFCAKLTGWKSTLSFIGRITLARHVLNAFPFYTMQTRKIQVSVLDEIIRIIRCFYLGHDTSTRKLHLDNWDTLIRPTDYGGLGLRFMCHLNRVALAKTT